ncbi:MAG: hypothetical protein HY282_18310 [Nitrospirae bacterium]|nr:hypothetical protein [Candidatus Manganitrophaceae bacterium]
MLLSALIMIGISFLFFLSYPLEDYHPFFKWIIRFTTQVHLIPSVRGKRYWPFFYGLLALIWGLGGLIWHFSS